jgi:hypothetical protein
MNPLTAVPIAIFGLDACGGRLTAHDDEEGFDPPVR